MLAMKIKNIINFQLKNNIQYLKNASWLKNSQNSLTILLCMEKIVILTLGENYVYF